MWGIHRPTALLREGIPTQGIPSEADRLLMVAYKLDRDALCPGGCGFYLDETREMDGEHIAEHVVCGACATRDEDQKDRKDEEPIPGEMTYVVEDF